jgi:hypothetical protein
VECIDCSEPKYEQSVVIDCLVVSSACLPFMSRVVCMGWWAFLSSRLRVKMPKCLLCEHAGAQSYADWPAVLSGQDAQLCFFQSARSLSVCVPSEFRWSGRAQRQTSRRGSPQAQVYNSLSAECRCSVVLACECWDEESRQKQNRE